MTRDAHSGGRAVPLGIFLLVLLSSCWFGSYEFNANNATRLFAAISIAEDGNATIDEYAKLTVDEAHFGRHVYLDKAPGMTLMAVPVVAATDRVTGDSASGMEKSVFDYWLTRFLLLRLRLAAAFSSGLLTAIAATLVYRIGLGVTRRPGAALFGSLGFALGTTMWGWSTTIFGHAVVADLFVIAIWAVWRGAALEPANAPPGLGFALLAGLALGWAVVVEYQAVLAGSVIAAWAYSRFRRYPPSDRARLIAATVIGGIVALTPLIGYNLFAFGTVFRLGYQGVTGFTGMQQGFFGLTYPKPGVLFALLFGLRRGFLWVAPVLVLAPPGLTRLGRDRDLRDIAIMAGAGALVVLLVNCSYVYWDGGASTGPRHSVPAIAFLALGFAPLWASLDSARGRIAAGGLLALSMTINLFIAATDIAASESYDFPLWQSTIHDGIMLGLMRDVPADWLGWSPWAGLLPYAATALPLLAWIVLSLPEADLPPAAAQAAPDEERAAHQHQHDDHRVG